LIGGLNEVLLAGGWIGSPVWTLCLCSRRLMSVGERPSRRLNCGSSKMSPLLQPLCSHHSQFSRSLSNYGLDLVPVFCFSLLHLRYRLEYTSQCNKKALKLKYTSFFRFHAFNTLRTGDEFSRFWRFFFTTLKDR
jgi:hypothetical protein